MFIRNNFQNYFFTIPSKGFLVHNRPIIEQALIMDSNQENKRNFELAEKWMNGTITPEEEKEFSVWYNSDQNRLVELPKTFIGSSSEHHTRMVKNLNRKIGYTQHHRLYKVRMISIAAAVILISGLVIFFYQQNSVSRNIENGKSNSTVQSEIFPGSNKAILTLSNGKKINLTDVNNGMIAQQTGIKISKTADGQLIYQIAETEAASNPLEYNTIVTPVGGQYQVQLPDGTKVWLNSLSSIKFPTSFSTQVNRTVEVVGEAFFEVEKNKEKPFIVKSDKQEIRVLGTHFNVSTYSDEATVRTTLFEGSIEVSSRSGSVVKMKPGQQSILRKDQLEIKAVNVDEFNSWKNGYFWFNNENIKSIMRKFSRWYDIEVTYQGEISAQEFNGKISRYKSLDQVLRILEQTQTIHFTSEGRRIIVIGK